MGGKGAIVVDIDPAKREAAKRAGAFAASIRNAPDAVAADCRTPTKGRCGRSIDFVGNTQTAQLGHRQPGQGRQA